MPKNADVIANHLMQHCLIYLMSAQCPQISVIDEERICINDIFEKSILRDKSPETITISGHGVVACFAVDSNGYIINDSEQFSLFDKESGKVIVHDFTYTTKIGAKSEVKVYVEHNLLANSYGNVIHKAYLN